MHIICMYLYTFYTYIHTYLHTHTCIYVFTDPPRGKKSLINLLTFPFMFLISNLESAWSYAGSNFAMASANKHLLDYSKQYFTNFPSIR